MSQFELNALPLELFPCVLKKVRLVSLADKPRLNCSASRRRYCQGPEDVPLRPRRRPTMPPPHPARDPLHLYTYRSRKSFPPKK